MAKRINRAIELLEADQALYYDGPHTGHVLTYEQGREDAKTWADYINVGMEHGDFDMKGLSDYMRGMAGRPTRAIARPPSSSRRRSTASTGRTWPTTPGSSARSWDGACTASCSAKRNRPTP
jgi:hypothetical protein